MKNQIVEEAKKELKPFCEKIVIAEKEGKTGVWFDEMDDIIRKYALQYGISEHDINGNFPEYLGFFELIVTDNEAFI